MAYDTLKNINQIIERDSKDTTYKFALLRATIEVIQERSPYQEFQGDRVVLPVGLLILKWLEYYYPIIEQELPQRNGDDLDSFTLSFRPLFKEVTDFYKMRGGLSVFYSELIRGNLPGEMEDTVFQLCKKLRDTIKDQPMRYIGNSVNGTEYSIYHREETNIRLMQPDKMDVNFLIENFTRFSIPMDYFKVMELMGSFVTGMHSILINWAEFTVDKDKSLNMNQVLETILKSPQVARNVLLPEEQADVLMSVSELLKPTGKAYFTVRRDLKRYGYRTHYVHKVPTYQCNVKLPYKTFFKNDFCEIYEYQHFTQVDNGKEGIFENPSPDAGLISELATVYSIYDKYPVSKGHALVIPKRKSRNYFGMTDKEKTACQIMTERVKTIVEKKYQPDGFNIGFNMNEAAGQAVFHTHIHIIPRYKGDVENPRGGIRNVIPGMGDY